MSKLDKVNGLFAGFTMKLNDFISWSIFISRGIKGDISPPFSWPFQLSWVPQYQLVWDTSDWLLPYIRPQFSSVCQASDSEDHGLQLHKLSPWRWILAWVLSRFSCPSLLAHVRNQSVPCIHGASTRWTQECWLLDLNPGMLVSGLEPRKAG